MQSVSLGSIWTSGFLQAAFNKSGTLEIIDLEDEEHHHQVSQDDDPDQESQEEDRVSELTMHYSPEATGGQRVPEELPKQVEGPSRSGPLEPAVA